jgi:hypothetical protein
MNSNAKLSIIFRFFVFRCLPLIIFSILIFSQKLRWWAVGAMIIYIISLAIYGQDYEGRRVFFGINKNK